MANSKKVSLAMLDLVPVVLFFILGILFYRKMAGVASAADPGFRMGGFFLAGVLVCTVGGFCKVIWKFIIVLTGKDRTVLPKIFRIGMFGGFAVLVLASVFSGERFLTVLHGMVSFPAVIFLAAGAAGMALMIVMSAKMEKESVRANWIEEGTNTLAQTMFLICLLLAGA
jgi:hypothetical protein